MRAWQRQGVKRLGTVVLCATLLGIWLLARRGGHDSSWPSIPSQARASVRQPSPPQTHKLVSARDRGPAKPASPAASPAETAQLLQSLHQKRDYAAIAPLIVADRRAAMLNLLRAIDDVLTINGELQNAVAKAYGGSLAGHWDLSPMENNLGPFSTQVLIVNQSFKGDGAVVTLQEGDNVPLAHAQFEWADGRWQYRPEATPAQLPQELDKLTCILRELTESVQRGASFDACYNSFARRVFPQIRRIVTGGDDHPATLVAGRPADSAD